MAVIAGLRGAMRFCILGLWVVLASLPAAESITPVVGPPVISSKVGAVRTQVGSPFGYGFTADNANSLGASGLPGGVQFDPATGLISGTPTVTGTYAITLSATNGWGTTPATLPLAVVADVILTAVGGGVPTDPTAVGLTDLDCLAIGPDGTLYVSDRTRVLSLAPDGVMRLFAGGGGFGSFGDGWPALAAGLRYVTGLAADVHGNVFISDGQGQVIRRVDGVTGIITTVAGTGVPGFAGDGGSATLAQLAYPTKLAMDGDDLYIADQGNGRVRRIDGVSGVINTVAGDGQFTSGPDGVLATASSLRGPHGLAIDGDHNLFIAEEHGWMVRRVDALSGLVSTIAGSPMASELYGPRGLAVDGAGNVYIADVSNHCIRRVDAVTGALSTIAGTRGYAAYSGDGGPAASAGLNNPTSIVFDGAGNLLIADFYNRRVRRIEAVSGTISTVAGHGGYESLTIGSLATGSEYGSFPGTAVDAAGNIYFSDPSHSRVCRVDAVTSLVTVAAGTGTSGFSGDGGQATAAQFGSPTSLAIDDQGRLLICDGGRIRRVDLLTGLVTTIAGVGTLGYSGDGGSASAAEILCTSVAVDGDGDIYFSGGSTTYIGAHCVRRIDSGTGITTTVAGTGAQGYNGDGIPAQTAMLNHPRITVDPAGNIFIAELGGGRIRRVDASTGLISTICGDGVHASTGDDGSAVLARVDNPAAVAVDSAGNLFIADDEGCLIRRIDAVTGMIVTLAGDGTEGSSGDGGLVGLARVSRPAGLVCDSRDWLFINDRGNGRIRVVRPAANTQAITMVAPAPCTYGDGPFTVSATSSSGLPVSIIVASGPGVKAGSSVTITGAGTIVLQAYQAGNASYFPAPIAQVTVPVARAQLIVTADPGLRQYGAANPPFTYTATGFIGADTVAALWGSLTSPAVAASPVGTYPIVRGSLSAANYLITYTGAMLTVVPAPLTITALDASRPYGAGNPAFGFNASGLVGSDRIASVVLTSAATAASPRGTYPITASGAVFGSGSAANYTLSYQSGILTVSQATLTVTASDSQRAYGSANPALGFTVTGLIGTDHVATATLITPATTASPPGTYVIAVGAAVFDSGDPADYLVVYQDGTLTVTKATLLVVADNKTRAFGAENPPLTATVTGWVNGDTEADLTTPIVLTTSAVRTSRIGQFEIRADGASSPAYAITFMPGVLTIKRVGSGGSVVCADGSALGMLVTLLAIGAFPWSRQQRRRV